MSFKVLYEDVDGVFHVLHEIDDKRVTRVGLVTKTGEAGATRIDADVTEVLLRFEYATQDARPTLQDVEAMQGGVMNAEEAQVKRDELDKLPSATNSGVGFMMESQERSQAEASAAEQAEDEEEGDPSQEPTDEERLVPTPAGTSGQSAETDTNPGFGNLGA
jgi:hypothetical protein